MSPKDDKNWFAHPSAVVDPAARVGAGTRIWHFSHIMKDAVVGENCNFGQNVVVSPGCTVGNGVKVQNNVSIYTGVTLEDGVFCGPSMVFTNVINPRSFIERKNEYRATRVGKGATIGANATIVCGHDIGAYALIGAGAVVTKDVPDFALIIGNPGRQVGWACWCGHTLDAPRALPEGESAEYCCSACNKHYRLTDSTLSLLDADTAD